MPFQKLRPTRTRGLYVTLSCLATKQSELVTIPTRSKVSERLKMFTQNIIKRLKNPLIVISSHNFNSSDHPIELYKDEFGVLME